MLLQTYNYNPNYKRTISSEEFIIVVISKKKSESIRLHMTWTCRQRRIPNQNAGHEDDTRPRAHLFSYIVEKLNGCKVSLTWQDNYKTSRAVDCRKWTALCIIGVGYGTVLRIFRRSLSQNFLCFQDIKTPKCNEIFKTIVFYFC